VENVSPAGATSGPEAFTFLQRNIDPIGGVGVQETQAVKLKDIIGVVEGEVLIEPADRELDIASAAGCDLMSDVLAYAKPYCLLVTGLTNTHVIRTAEMADIAAIVFVRGKRPGNDTMALAEEKGIPLISSPHSMFEMCGRLHQAGLSSCDGDDGRD
jgi:predicted transcriptional regulator